MTFADLVTIAPLVAAVLVTAAVLFFDRAWPGRRGPVLVACLGGLALIVVFGLFPGILLSLVGGTVDVSLGDAGAGSAIAIDPLVVALGLGIIAAAVVVRVATLPLGPRSGETATTATAASAEIGS